MICEDCTIYLISQRFEMLRSALEKTTFACILLYN